MRAKSSTLFHFTPQLEYLRSILKDGFYPRFCLEDVTWMDWYSQDYIAYPMICFCDIPLSKLIDHTSFYGSYGIGLKRHWGERNLLAPVIYTPKNSQVYDLAVSLCQRMIFTEAESSQSENDANNLLSLIKPVTGIMKVDDENQFKEFYLENEWRYIPKTKHAIPENQFLALRDAANKEMRKNHKLAFLPTDIQYIFVNREEEIPEAVDIIRV